VPDPERHVLAQDIERDRKNISPPLFEHPRECLLELDLANVYALQEREKAVVTLPPS
jgi:hypothetical protein